MTEPARRPLSDSCDNEIDRAIAATGASPVVLSEEELGELRQRVERIYAEPTPYQQLWERLPSTAYRFEIGEKPHLVFACVPDGVRPVLFLDEFRSLRAWEFASVEALESVIMESFAFECYFTDREASFLLAWTHEETVVLCGVDPPWGASSR